MGTELESLISLGVVTLSAIGLVIFLGLKLNKAFTKRAPETLLKTKLTLVGTAVLACLVSFWLVCLIAGTLRPESSLGAFVGTTIDAAAVIVASIFFTGIVGEVLERIGYPMVTRGDNS